MVTRQVAKEDHRTPPPPKIPTVEPLWIPPPPGERWLPAPWYVAPLGDPPRRRATPGHPYRDLSWVPPRPAAAPKTIRT